MPGGREEGEQQPDADLAWEGDSKEVISQFPDAVKQNLGFQLRLLQQGEEPTDYRPMQTVGAGVFELRDEDQSSWYRVIYLSRIDDVIHVLHCFEKKTKKTPQKEIDLAKQRLKKVKERLTAKRREEKHARRK